MPGLHWWPKPEAGAIVWCHFPNLPQVQPAIKPRPALLIQVFEDDVPHYRVLVAYGTSQKTDKLHKGEFLLARAMGEPFRLAGLGHDTKFNLAARAELDYSSDWFKVPPGMPHGQTPMLGVLHASLMRAFQAAWRAITP